MLVLHLASVYRQGVCLLLGITVLLEAKRGQFVKGSDVRAEEIPQDLASYLVHLLCLRNQCYVSYSILHKVDFLKTYKYIHCHLDSEQKNRSGQ